MLLTQVNPETFQFCSSECHILIVLNVTIISVEFQSCSNRNYIYTHLWISEAAVCLPALWVGSLNFKSPHAKQEKQRFPLLQLVKLRSKKPHSLHAGSVASEWLKHLPLRFASRSQVLSSPNICSAGVRRGRTTRAAQRGELAFWDDPWLFLAAWEGLQYHCCCHQHPAAWEAFQVNYNSHANLPPDTAASLPADVISGDPLTQGLTQGHSFSPHSQQKVFGIACWSKSSVTNGHFAWKCLQTVAPICLLR